MFKFIQKRKYWYLLSAIILIPGIIAIFLGGLKLGIDFTGGSLIRLGFSGGAPTTSEINTALESKNLGSLSIQPIDEQELTIRLKTIDNATYQDLISTLKSNFGEIEEKSFESIGPTIGKELQHKAVIAIVLVLLCIIGYISYAFRKISSSHAQSWVYGVSAVIALFHDLLVVIGIFAILGKLFDVEIDVLFITAILTVLGFSVHDTIVVFDRIREHLKNFSNKTFEVVVNESVNETLVRSINTSMTTLLVLLALYLFGGDSIKYFTLALIIGITIGTYSSIFIASPLVVDWYNFKNK